MATLRLVNDGVGRAIRRRAFAKRVTRFYPVSWVNGVRKAGTRESVASRAVRRRNKRDERPDTIEAREAEVRRVWDTIPVVRRSDKAVPEDPTNPYRPVSRADVEALVWLRRKAFADGRYRQFLDVGDYSAMALQFLGRRADADGTYLAELARLAVPIRNEYRRDRVNLFKGLKDSERLQRVVASYALKRWQTNPQPERASLGAEDHSEFVTAYNSIGKIDRAGEIADWLNGLIPGGGTITRPDVERALKSNFGKALDDGAEFTVTSAGRVYDVRLWPVATASPEVVTRSVFVGGLENRLYAYDHNVKTLMRASEVSGEIGGKYSVGLNSGAKDEASPGQLNLNANASFGYGELRGSRKLPGISYSDYLFIRAKEPLGRVKMQVVWEVAIAARKVQQGQQGPQWTHEILRNGQGEPLSDNLEFMVPDFTLPYAPEEIKNLPDEVKALYDIDYRQPYEITNRDHFPLWDLPFAGHQAQTRREGPGDAPGVSLRRGLQFLEAGPGSETRQRPTIHPIG